MSEKREFTGVFIPAHIWASKELIPAEKMILGEIDALSKKTGWSDASRNHYAEWLSCSLPNVTYYFEKLQRLGFIEIVKRPGYRSKTRVIAARFYEKEVVSPIDGGSQSGLPLPVSPIDGGSQSGLPEIQDKDKGKKVYTSEFENGWKLYALASGSKRKAFDTFQRLSKEDQLRALAGIPFHVAATTLSKDSPGHTFKPLRCHFETYLSQSRWEAYEDAQNNVQDQQSTEPTEWDKHYQSYLNYTKENYPEVIDNIAQLSKIEFIRLKTEDFQHASRFSQQIHTRILLEAQKDFQCHTPQARKHDKIWPYFMQKVSEEMKSMQI